MTLVTRNTGLRLAFPALCLIMSACVSDAPVQTISPIVEAEAINRLASNIGSSFPDVVSILAEGGGSSVVFHVAQNAHIAKVGSRLQMTIEREYHQGNPQAAVISTRRFFIDDISVEGALSGDRITFNGQRPSTILITCDSGRECIEYCSGRGCMSDGPTSNLTSYVLFPMRSDEYQSYILGDFGLLIASAR